MDPLRAREAIEALERSGVPPAAPPEHLVREPGPPPDEKTQKRNEAIQSSGNDRHAEDKESTTPRELGPSRG